MATHKEQKITITASTGLSKEEAERMRTEAESHAEEDRKRLAEIEARNQLDNRVYQVEKLLRENREKLTEADAKLAEEALEVAKRALAEGGLEQMKSASESLERASHKVAETLYRSGATPASGAAAAGGQPGTRAASSGQTSGSGEVIDAEYVDVDESKKPN